MPDSKSDENKNNERSPQYYDFFLDITSDVCPLTFVKTKLLLEKMAAGEVAEVRLNDGEPLQNVPRSVREHGHEILALDAEAPGSRVHRLRVRKSSAA